MKKKNTKEEENIIITEELEEEDIEHASSDFMFLAKSARKIKNKMFKH